MSGLAHWATLWLVVGFLAALVGWKQVYAGGLIRTRWWLLAVTFVSGPLGWWVVWPTLEDEAHDTTQRSEKGEGDGRFSRD